MDLARKIVMSEASVSDEAKNRINSARLRDFAFAVRKIAGERNFTTEDFEQLAAAILKVADEGGTLSLANVVSQLVKEGRTRHKAEELAGAVFR